jgi:hypothetical protein
MFSDIVIVLWAISPLLIRLAVLYRMVSLTLRQGEEKMFFDLANVREKVYYYAINEKKLREQGEYS